MSSGEPLGDITTVVLGHMQRYETYSMLLSINYKNGPGHYSKQLIRLLQ